MKDMKMVIEVNDPELALEGYVIKQGFDKYVSTTNKSCYYGYVDEKILISLNNAFGLTRVYAKIILVGVVAGGVIGYLIGNNKKKSEDKE